MVYENTEVMHGEVYVEEDQLKTMIEDKCYWEFYYIYIKPKSISEIRADIKCKECTFIEDGYIRIR